MKKVLIFFLYVNLTILTSFSLFSETYQAEVENTSNRAYFNAALNAIQNAKESITMAMYLISFNPNEKEQLVKKLLDALISAKNRGVSVKVILEYHSEKDFTPEGLSYNAYQYLKNNEINIYFDKSSPRCLHAKTIVIDKEIVITGSSNWSIPAFISSDETNVLIKSKPLAQEILKCIEEIPVREEPIKEDKDTFAIPLSFCSSTSGALKRIVTVNDERCLDILLILWETNQHTISCDFIAQRLGLFERMKKNNYRRQIKRVLNKLEKRYRLTEYKWYAGKNNIDIALLSYPGGQPIRFPKNYFTYGWDRKLSLCAKAVLITMYAELQEVTNAVTSLPILYLSKKYGIKNFTYSEGIQELKRYNIIKVQYNAGQKDRLPTRITILGIYNMDEYNKMIGQLCLQYGKEKVTEAQALADIINGRYDACLIRDILVQMDYYGIENVYYAFSVIAKKSPDNYKRTYKYVIGILKKTRNPSSS